MTRTAGTVLVADDDSGIRSLYQCWFSSADAVRTAADGAAALEQLDEEVDVVLLDREMPRKDGVAVARELDRRDLDPAVVMISGVEPAVDLLDVPVDDYLRKPVTGETVVDRVERALAAAESPPRHRRLVALDRRRRIVEAAVSRHRLADDPDYQRALDHLEREGWTLDDDRVSAPTVGNESGGEPRAAAGPFDVRSCDPRQ